jgi:hypothetical protein
MKIIHNKTRVLLFAAISSLIVYAPLTKGMFGVLERDIHQAFAEMQNAESAQELKTSSERAKQLIEKIKEPQIKQIYENDFEQEYSKAVAGLEKFKRAEFEAKTLEKLKEKGIEPKAYADLLRMAKQKTLELQGRKKALEDLSLKIAELEKEIAASKEKNTKTLEDIKQQIQQKSQGDESAQVVATIAKVVSGLLEEVYKEDFKKFLDAKDLAGSFKKYLNHLIDLKIKSPTNIWEIYQTIIPTQEQLKEILK